MFTTSGQNYPTFATCSGCQHFMYCLTTVHSDWKTAEFKYNTLIMYLVCYILANLSRRLIFELIVYTGIRRPSVRRPRPTLVTMATYSFHRLIMEKWKLTISAESLGIFDFCYYVY